MLDTLVIGLSIGRIGVGVSSLFLLPSLSRVVLKSDDFLNFNGLLFARMFGVRDAALGVVALIGLQNREWLAPILLCNACVELPDLLIISYQYFRGQGNKKLLALAASLAGAGCFGWFTAWCLAN